MSTPTEYDTSTGPLAQWSERRTHNPIPARQKCNPDNLLRRDGLSGAAPETAHSAENAAVAVLSGSLAPDLARVILAWPSLPDESKAAILALVAAHEATQGKGGRE